MAKLILQFEDRVLSECVIGPHGVTIGASNVDSCASTMFIGASTVT